MSAGIFPHKRSTTREEIASERRLAYVALTRGQDKVTVLSAKEKEVTVMKKGRAVKKKMGGASSFISEACIRDEDEQSFSQMGGVSRTASINAFEDFLASTEYWLYEN